MSLVLLAGACGPQDSASTAEPNGSGTGASGGAGSSAFGGGSGAVAPAANSSSGSSTSGSTIAGAGSSAAASAGAGTATTPGAGTVTMPFCPTYQDDFLPRVNAPVCSTCHAGTSKLPDWGQYSQVSAFCSKIGSLVASGAMPPSSSKLTLSADQKALVAAWVGLGCPQNASALPQSCRPMTGSGAPAAAGGTAASGGGAGGTTAGAGGAPSVPGNAAGMGNFPGTGSAAGAGGTTSNPPSALMMSITRAEWDSAKETLRLEGECSDYSASLSAEFGGRTEPMTNDMGRFRNEFTNVASNPGTVTVTTTSGVSAASSVTVK